MKRSERPRVGFLGLGWIGRHRLEALVDANLVDVVALADASSDALDKARAKAKGAASCGSLDELLRHDLDGVVIATPSAQHAAEAAAALERGVAVFCQKPLGRSAAETESVVRCAERMGQLLHVDFCYRYTQAATRVKALLDSGEIGSVYTGRLVFHNAYGPDKDWYYQRALSGGGCVMDLGIHLVDLALWLLDAESATCRRTRLYAQGTPLELPTDDIEDYAVAELELDDGRCVEIACSWRLPAGCDAVIRAELWGPRGGAIIRNVDGSFYDILAERTRGTSRERLSEPKDEWGGRALVRWAQALAEGRGFDPEAQRLVSVARIVDQMYGG